MSFLGRLDDRALTDWYHSADIAVLTPAPHEGFGLATLEALAAGCPVVAARTGATPELLDGLEPGLVADRATPDDFAAALDAGIALAQDPAFRVRCSEHAQRWSWAERLPEWTAMLEETSVRPRGARRTSTPTGRASVFGIPLDALTTDETLQLAARAIETRDAAVHTSLNAAKVVRIQRDEALRRAVARSTVITADGQAIVWAARLLGTHVPERVAGIDLMIRLIRLADERGLRVFLLGARPEVLDRVCREVARSYPQVVVCGARDGYFARDEEAERRCHREGGPTGRSLPCAPHAREGALSGPARRAAGRAVRDRCRRSVRRPRGGDEAGAPVDATHRSRVAVPARPGAPAARRSLRRREYAVPAPDRARACAPNAPVSFVLRRPLRTADTLLS